jgi:hypothetical protein
LVILAGLAVVTGLLGFFVLRPQWQRMRAQKDTDVLRVAVAFYRQDHGDYPRGNLAGIARLLRGETVDGQNVERLDYIEVTGPELNGAGELVDPWGTPYRIITEPRLVVYSCGPNRLDQDGQGDDIVGKAEPPVP